MEIFEGQELIPVPIERLNMHKSLSEDDVYRLASDCDVLRRSLK